MTLAYFDFPMKYGYDNEFIGMSVIDPVVVPQAPEDLASSTFTPSSKVKVILSNNAEENAIMTIGYGLNYFPNTTEGWASVNSTMREQFANIVGNDTVDELMAGVWSNYPQGNYGPQQAWDVITTDLRATCPINDIAVEMAKNSNYEIYRLYITNAYPGWSSFHIWEALALFGFKESFIPGFDIGLVDGFRDEMQKIVKDFAYGDVDNEWEAYPANVKLLPSYAPWYEIVEGVQVEQCAFWKLNNLDKYGWQN